MFAILRSSGTRRLHSIRLDNRGAFYVEQLLELEAREKSFAGRNRNGALRHHRRESMAVETSLRLRRFHFEADTEDQVGSVEFGR
jgi:hypothetical protein